MRLLALVGAVLLAAPAFGFTITATAAPLDCHSIEVVWWDDSGVPQMYAVERSDDGGGTFRPLYWQPSPSQPTSADPSPTSAWIDTSCAPDTTYVYRVGIVPFPPHPTAVMVTMVAPIVRTGSAGDGAMCRAI